MAKDKKVKKVMKIKEDKKKVTRISGMEDGSRIKDMSETTDVVLEPGSDTVIKQEKGVQKRVRGKSYLTAKSQIDKLKAYPISEAIDLIKKSSYSKVSGSFEIHLNLNQKGVSGDVSLPHFQGKVKKVVTVDEELLKELEAGKINFDVLLASAADMPKLLPFAKVLGPKGLMPNPKNGTLVPDTDKALKGFSTTALHYKSEKDFPLIHSVFGKLDQKEEELVDNFNTFIKSVDPKKIKRVFIKSTMSPSVRVSI